MNPAWPTPVYSMPVCWNAEARKRSTPHTAPVKNSFFVFCLFVYLSGFSLSVFLFLIALEMIAMGHKNRVARVILDAWKVSGPIFSMPSLWETNANPLIIAVTSKNILPRMFFAILSPFWKCKNWIFSRKSLVCLENFL